MEQGSPETTTDTNALSVDEIISNNIVKHEDGTYGGVKEVDGKKIPLKLGEAIKELGLSEDKATAVRAEVRRRSTESAYTRERKRVLEMEAELKVYKDLVPKDLGIPKEKQEELDVLKFEDPDKWLTEMTAIKNAATAEFQKKTEEAISEAKLQAVKQDTVAARAKQLEDFNSKTDKPLTDEQLQYDIPPRLTKQLEDGDITFAEMLEKAHAFINGTKVVTNPNYTEEPSFEATPGGSTPQQSNINVKDTTYENIIL